MMPGFTITKTAITVSSRKLTGIWTLAVPNEIKVSGPFHREWKITFYSSIARLDIIQWCKQTFGEHGRNRKYRWRIKYDSHLPDTVFLRNESDVAMFRLRWM